MSRMPWYSFSFFFLSKPSLFISLPQGNILESFRKGSLVPQVQTFWNRQTSKSCLQIPLQECWTVSGEQMIQCSAVEGGALTSGGIRADRGWNPWVIWLHDASFAKLRVICTCWLHWPVWNDLMASVCFTEENSPCSECPKVLVALEQRYWCLWVEQMPPVHGHRTAGTLVLLLSPQMCSGCTETKNASYLHFSEGDGVKLLKKEHITTKE